MRYLGLDLGEKRVGVAVSDPDGKVATPLTTLERRPGESVADALRYIVDEYEIDVIVVGLPRREDGSEGAQARKARDEADRLERSFDLGVTFYDERFTSRIVVNAAREAGVVGARRAQRARKRGTVDRMAATLILQGYLDNPRPDTELDDSESSS